MKKIRVIIVIDDLGCGGAEKSLISLLPLLDYSKIEVDLMMTRRGGVFEKYIPREVNVVDFPIVGQLKALASRLLYSVALRCFKRNHSAELKWSTTAWIYPSHPKGYDVAIAYQQGFPTYYVAQKVRAKRKIAWVNADITKVGYRDDFNRPYYDIMDVVVPVSDKLNTILRDSHFVNFSKLKTVYDIINVDLIKRMSIEEVNLNHGTRVVLTTVGRMVQLKGYDMAAKAAAILKEKGFDFVWYFVGDGDQMPAIKLLVEKLGLQNQIVFVGMTPNPYPYMKACDIYVQTSRDEGFGITLTEARILNKPVVSTNFSVVYDQIKDGVNGLICEKREEDIAEKIITLITNPSLQEKLADATKHEVNTTAITEPQKVMDLILS